MYYNVYSVDALLTKHILPGAPHVQAITYINLLGITTGDMSSLATVTCSTRNSPPTNVTWMKDGEEIVVDVIKYRSIHEVTDRANSHYNVKLIIGDISGIAGVHNYTCVVNNSRGGHWKTVTTNVSSKYGLFSMDMSCTLHAFLSPCTVWSESRIIPLRAPVHGHNFTLFCVTYLQPRLAHLSHYIVLEWVGPEGVPLAAENNITVARQSAFTTSSLQFTTVNLIHHGPYVCRAILNISSLVSTPTTSSELYLTILGKFDLTKAYRGIGSLRAQGNPYLTAFS